MNINKIDVAQFLNEKHEGHYKIINLSERQYDIKKFNGNVIVHGFPDHHAPPLLLL